MPWELTRILVHFFSLPLQPHESDPHSRIEKTSKHTVDQPARAQLRCIIGLNSRCIAHPQSQQLDSLAVYPTAPKPPPPRLPPPKDIHQHPPHRCWYGLKAFPSTTLEFDIKVEPEHRQKVERGCKRNAVLCRLLGQCFDIESVGRKRREGGRLISEVVHEGRGKSIHDREEGGGVESARLGAAGAEVRWQG